MRLPWSLKWALPLGLAALLLVFTSFATWNSLSNRLASLTQVARQDVLDHTGHLARMAEQGLHSSPVMVASDLGQISTYPRVLVVLILDDQGRVLMAHRRAWIGTSAKSQMPDFDDGWRLQVMAGRLPHVRTLDDGLRLAAMQSFELPASNNEVRSSRRGAVYVQMDLNSDWQEARYSTLMSRVPGLVLAMLVLLAVWWLLRRFVARPLQALSQAAGRLKQGQLGSRAAVQGPLEIA